VPANFVVNRIRIEGVHTIFFGYIELTKRQLGKVDCQLTKNLTEAGSREPASARSSDQEFDYSMTERALAFAAPNSPSREHPQPQGCRRQRRRFGNDDGGYNGARPIFKAI